MNSIYELIDSLARKSEFKNNTSKLYDYLIGACPSERLTKKLEPDSIWKSAVKDYVNELDKVHEWNNLSINK